MKGRRDWTMSQERWRVRAFDVGGKLTQAWTFRSEDLALSCLARETPRHPTVALFRRGPGEQRYTKIERSPDAARHVHQERP